MPSSETLGEGIAVELRVEHDLPHDAVATSSTTTTIAVTILAGVRRRINERHVASTALMGSPPKSTSAMIQPGSDPSGAAGGAAATGELHGMALGDGHDGAPVTHPVGGVFAGGAAGGVVEAGGTVAGGLVVGRVLGGGLVVGVDVGVGVGVGVGMGVGVGVGVGGKVIV